MIAKTLGKEFLIKFSIIAVALGVFWAANPTFVKLNTFSVVALITLPISLYKTTQSDDRLPIWIMILLGFLGIIAPTTTGVFIYLLFLIIYVLGYHTSIIKLPALIHIGMITPFFIYVDRLISFPLRIQLSKVVTGLLSPFTNVQHAGNSIILNHAEYLVDEACAGLYMLKYGVLFGTLTLSWKVGQATLQWWKYILGYLTMGALILLANIFRILILVLWNIGPENGLHETIGLLIYFSVVLFPFYIFVSFYTNNIQRNEKNVISCHKSTFTLPLAVLLSLYLIIITVNYYRPIQENNQIITIDGYLKNELASGIFQFKKNDAIVYVKPPVAGFRSDHNPTICWKGSGYEFKKIDKINLNNQQVNIAELSKGTEKLFSAWWFESESCRTADQWVWRKKSFIENQRFHLINLTCEDPSTLKSNLMILLDTPSLINSSKL